MIIILLREKDGSRYIGTKYGVEYVCRKIARERLERKWYNEYDSAHLSLLLGQPASEETAPVYRWLEQRNGHEGEDIELHALEEI